MHSFNHKPLFKILWKVKLSCYVYWKQTACQSFTFMALFPLQGPGKLYSHKPLVPITLVQKVSSPFIQHLVPPQAEVP